MKKFVAMLAVIAVFAASMMNAAHAGERHVRHEATLTQAGYAYDADVSMSSQNSVDHAHATEHGHGSGKPVNKSLCEIACHAPVMVHAHYANIGLETSLVTQEDFSLIVEALPSSLVGVPDQPPKLS